MADQFKESMDKKASQLSYLIFSGKVNSKQPYTKSHDEFTNGLKGYKPIWGDTNVIGGVLEATNVLKTDPATRVKDDSIRKIVFVCTDGEQGVAPPG